MKENLLRWSFFLFLIFIPFGTKKFIFSFAEPISELNSIFLFASDLLLIVFISLFFLGVRNHSGILKRFGTGFLLTFLAFAFVSIFLATHESVAFYHFLSLVLLILGALAVAGTLHYGVVDLEKIMIVLAGSAIFQALVGFLQFKFQRSIGLWFIGEPVGTALTKGFGTVMVQGGILMRAFGTMSHANIFAAFLVIGLIAFYYLYLHSAGGAYFKKMIIAIAIFFLGMGLVFAFSRSGWITAGAVTVFTLIWGLFNREYRRAALNLLLILLTIFYLLLSSFSWLIVPRAHLSMKDSSISDRYVFNLAGLEIIKSRPFGVGIGNELQYAVDNELYAKRGLLKPYSWQPIHNIYLLVASEVGIFGLFAFIIFITSLALRRKIFSNLEGATVAALLVFVAVFGLFDHFFWDLQSGRLMMWLILGILMGASPVRDFK